MTNQELRLRCLESAARTAVVLPDGSVETEKALLVIAETFLAWVQEAPVEMPSAEKPK